MTCRCPCGHHQATACWSPDHRLMKCCWHFHSIKTQSWQRSSQKARRHRGGYYVWNNTVFNVERTMDSKKVKKDSKAKAAVHRLGNKRPPGMLTPMKIVKSRVKNPVTSQRGGRHCLKVMKPKDLREMERNQTKLVLSGHPNKMSRSRPSLKTIPYSTIWPMRNTRTRRSEIICSWNCPAACSTVVSLKFHINSLYPVRVLLSNVVYFLLQSRKCCAILIIMTSGANWFTNVFD